MRRLTIAAMVLCLGCNDEPTQDADMGQGGHQNGMAVDMAPVLDQGEASNHGPGLDSSTTPDAAVNDMGVTEDSGTTADMGVAELKAFPSAYGAGAYTDGGRGGNVYHVTSLENSGPGSFRAAFDEPRPLTIVFDVSGVIELTDRLNVREGNFTIAGQTAPEGGITIDGDRFALYDADDVVVRFMRFRGGFDGGEDIDSFEAANTVTNQIFDHCSFSFGDDEAGTWNVRTDDPIDKVTVQRSIFAETRSTGTIFGGQPEAQVGELSFHHNLFYNISHRYPNIAGEGGYFEIVNNVAWTVRNRLVRANRAVNLNHTGNYYDYGRRPISNTRMNMFPLEDGQIPAIYTAGNQYVAVNEASNFDTTVPELNADNTLGWRYFIEIEGVVDRGERLPANYFVDTPHPALGSPIPVQTATEAFNDIRGDVGANRRLDGDGTVHDNTDALDAEWLSNVNSGTYTDRLATSEYDVPPIPSVSRPDDYDTDGDGMPNAWETANGFDPDDSADGNGDADNDGYTNLEEFLNLVD